MNAQWYAVRVRPQKEYGARNHLLKLGYEVFLPLAHQSQPRMRRRESPLFPGYLFLQCDLTNPQLDVLQHVSELLGFVHFDGQTPPVPDSVIVDLREMVRVLNQHGGLWHPFQAGERVWVKLGNVENPGKVLVTLKSPEERVWVLLEFLGSMVRAQVHLRDIFPIREAPPQTFVGPRPPRRTRGRGRWIRGSGPAASFA